MSNPAPGPVLETDRLLLRPWRAADLDAFAAMNADAEVMTYFQKPLTRDETAAMMGRIQDHFARHGFGFGAVERKADRALLGMAGLAAATFDAPVTPCVEVGWRLARPHWGAGYATEAGRAWLAHGFHALALDEITAFVVPTNLASQAVMTRLGMRRDPDRGFDHPALPEGHPLRPHWLYAIDRTAWAGRGAV